VGEVTQKAITLNVYGRSKTGKTRLACTFPKPLLLIGSEDGTASVRNVKGVDFIRVYKAAEIDQLFDMVRKTSKYKTVCIDHAGGLQDMILKEILGLDELPIQRTFGMAKRDDWMACSAQTKERLNAHLHLAETHSINAVVIAHERDFSKKGDEAESTASDLERSLPQIGAYVQPAVKDWLDGACDYICQTFIRDKVIYEKSVMDDGSEMLIPITSKDKEYCLRVGPSSVFTTGFRLVDGINLPDAIVNPSYEKIRDLALGKSVK